MQIFRLFPIILATLFLVLFSQPGKAVVKNRAVLLSENQPPKAKNLNFLKAYRGKYAFRIKLFSKSAFTNRLKKLTGNRYKLITDTCIVALPIKIENNQFIVEGCQPHNCPDTNYIIVYDFSTNVMFVGIKKEFAIRTFSENGRKCQRLSNWEKGIY